MPTIIVVFELLQNTEERHEKSKSRKQFKYILPSCEASLIFSTTSFFPKMDVMVG